MSVGSADYIPVPRLDQQVAIVTGGGNGIGRAIALRLAQEGARVVVAELDEAAGTAVAAAGSRMGLKTEAFHTDVRKEESLSRLADHVLGAHSRIDILVNNAAIFSTIRMTRTGFVQLPVEEWDALFEVNLRGAWLAARAVAPAMIREGSGRIINIGSASVFKGATDRIHYVSAKAGMIGFTRSLARELGPHGILVNCVAPGSTLSETDPDDPNVSLREAAVQGRAIPRLEYPEDVAGVVAFFASDDARFVTGQTLVVDGGAHMQ